LSASTLLLPSPSPTPSGTTSSSTRTFVKMAGRYSWTTTSRRWLG
jgi:hypothetical protein